MSPFPDLETQDQDFMQGTCRRMQIHCWHKHGPNSWRGLPLPGHQVCRPELLHGHPVQWSKDHMAQHHTNVSGGEWVIQQCGGTGIPIVTKGETYARRIWRNSESNYFLQIWSYLFTPITTGEWQDNCWAVNGWSQALLKDTAWLQRHI